MKAIFLAGALCVFAGLAAAQDIGMKEQGGIRWACGGAGVEERAALAAVRPRANMELLFVTAKRGGYLADVKVADTRQARVVFAFPEEPWDGIKASDEEKRQARTQ